MEHFYNIDSFEHFLRENTKDFKMMPKRRLWYSIYNNLHPSKKLPSFYTGILLLITILFFDFYNINNLNHKIVNYKYQIASFKPNINSKRAVTSLINNKLKNERIVKSLDNYTIENRNKYHFYNDISKDNSFVKMYNTEEKLNNFENNFPKIEQKENKIFSSKASSKNLEDYIKGNKINLTPFSYEIFATPSIGLNNLFDEYNNPLISSKNNNSRFKQISNLNLYAGGLITYNLNKKIRIKAGLEFNYSRSNFSDKLN